MQTNLHPMFKNTAVGDEAEAILRSCVHCGFCNATCPTYQELGDERDGPRGRIYLIKQLLETGEATEKTRTHMDRCLTCRSCETTCPSGVEYGRLADIGKEIIERQQTRPFAEQIMRWGLRHILPYRQRFTALLRLGQWLRPLMPAMVKEKIPSRVHLLRWPPARHSRRMLVLAGCTQPGTTPNTNIAAARVLDQLGVSLIELPKAGCCGAVSHHLSEHDEGLGFVRANIDIWWPAIEQGAEAIVVTASGCGTMVKDYGKLLKSDALYADKARRVSDIARDLSEVISVGDIEKLKFKTDGLKTAIHCPCSLQHGLQLPDHVDRLLEKAGIDIAKTVDKHLCCGSAGTYSLLQPAMSSNLLDNKLEALTVDSPDRIVTANVGCQLHLATRSQVPVQHWIELLEQGMSSHLK